MYYISMVWAYSKALLRQKWGNPADNADPDVSIYNNSPYIQDRFTLALSLPLQRDNSVDLAIAYYEESISAWVDLPSYEKGGYLYAQGIRLNGVFSIIKRILKVVGMFKILQNSGY